MERRPDIGFDSYDRLFPNQDTMPQGGFGNLIALPLQKGPRQQDNSVFVDEQLIPWGDQCAFLARVRKIGRSHVEGIVQQAERNGRILGVRLPPQEDGDDEPWTASPSRHRQESPSVGEQPETLEMVLGNEISIAKPGLHAGLRNRLLRLAAFQNPEFYKTQAMRLSTYDKPRVIACAGDRRRVPSRVSAQLRASGPPGQGAIRHGTLGYRRAQGWSPSDHLYAVRTRATPRECQGAGVGKRVEYQWS